MVGMPADFGLFLFVVGVPADKREGAKKSLLEQTVELNIAGDSGSMTNTTPATSQTMNFTLGQPFDYFMSSGRKVTVSIMKETATTTNPKGISSQTAQTTTALTPTTITLDQQDQHQHQ